MKLALGTILVVAACWGAMYWAYSTGPVCGPNAFKARVNLTMACLPKREIAGRYITP